MSMKVIGNPSVSKTDDPGSNPGGRECCVGTLIGKRFDCDSNDGVQVSPTPNDIVAEWYALGCRPRK